VRCRPFDQQSAEPTAARGQRSPLAEKGRPLTLPSPYGRGFYVAVIAGGGEGREPFSPRGRRWQREALTDEGAP
jgi:hypothetical protein